jgi:GAF domain-containing protein
VHQFRSATPSFATSHSVVAVRLINHALRSALPSLGDFGFVHVRAGRAITGIAAAHSRGERTHLARALMRAHRLQIGDPHSAVAQVIRTGAPVIRLDIRPDTASPDGPPRAARTSQLLRQLAPRCAVVVPITVRGIVLGAVSLCYAESGRRYTQAAVAPAARLALQIGSMLKAAAASAAPRLDAVTPHERHGTIVRRRVALRE